MLIERAGSAVARLAREMLGGTYGRRVDVIAGKGNNGADGRVAAERSPSVACGSGCSTRRDCPPALPAADLVIDAAYGTGFHGEWRAPASAPRRVLAVDIPSGVDGADRRRRTGTCSAADRTVTFAALKPGLLFGAGRSWPATSRSPTSGSTSVGARAHARRGSRRGRVVAAARDDDATSGSAPCASSPAVPG